MQSSTAWSPVSKFHSFALVFGKSIALSLAVCATMLCPGRGEGQTTLTSFEDNYNVQQDVFYRGTDQHIYFRYYNNTQGLGVQDVTALSGAPLAAPGTATTSFNDSYQNQQHVIFEAANGHIYQAFSNANPSAWYLQDITAMTGANPAAVATPLVSYCDPGTDIQYIFYIGVDQHVDIFYWHGGWFAEDGTTTAGAVAAANGSGLTGFYEPQSHKSHVFYEGTDQHVHELYAGLDPTAIFTTDNTATSGATLAEIGSALSSNFNGANTQENVYFEGIDQHIHHLIFNYTGNPWQVEDVTLITSGVPAVAGSSLSSFQDGVANQQHIFYIGVDQHLHQFFYGTYWEPEDVTFDSGAQIPALNSPLTTFKDDPDAQQHAYYLGVDDHFYHLWFSNRWYGQDLTPGAAVPAP